VQEDTKSSKLYPKKECKSM